MTADQGEQTGGIEPGLYDVLSRQLTFREAGAWGVVSLWVSCHSSPKRGDGETWFGCRRGRGPARRDGDGHGGGFTDHTSLRRGTARLLELAEGNKRLVQHAGAWATRLAQLEEQIGRRARKASDTKALAHSGRHPPATDQASSASAVPSLGTLAPAATVRGLDRRRAANPPDQRQLPLRWRGPRHGAIRLSPFRR